MAGGFALNTRQKIVAQPQLVKPTGGGMTELEIRRAGLLARIYLRINVVGTGTPGTPNPLGIASVIRRVRVVANSGLELYSMSGPGYAYIGQHMLEGETYPVTSQNQGTSAVAAGTFNLDMVIPIAVSMMDFTGLVLVQSEQILVTVQVDWEADTVVGGTGWTYTGTCTPYVEFFSVPLDPADAPPLNKAHVVLEEQRTVTGAGEYIYEPLRRPTYLQLAHGLGFGVAGADRITTARVRIEQSNYLFDGDINLINMLWRYQKGYARPNGVWLYDWMASSGLGNYGGARDRINTAAITSFESVFNATAAGQLYTIRRMLVDLA